MSEPNDYYFFSLSLSFFLLLFVFSLFWWFRCLPSCLLCSCVSSTLASLIIIISVSV